MIAAHVIGARAPWFCNAAKLTGLALLRFSVRPLLARACRARVHPRGAHAYSSRANLCPGRAAALRMRQKRGNGAGVIERETHGRAQPPSSCMARTRERCTSRPSTRAARFAYAAASKTCTSSAEALGHHAIPPLHRLHTGRFSPRPRCAANSVPICSSLRLCRRTCAPFATVERRGFSARPRQKGGERSSAAGRAKFGQSGAVRASKAHLQGSTCAHAA